MHIGYIFLYIRENGLFSTKNGHLIVQYHFSLNFIIYEIQGTN